MKLLLLLVVACAVLCMSLGDSLPSGDRVQTVMVPMRDGVKLHTVIAFPRDFDISKDKAIAIMDRSPYGADGLELINDIYVPFGFIAVGQDMRGTGQSEGEFTIWHSDADDSQDLGDWLISQSWCSGTIYTFGASADGLAAFRTPFNSPTWLDASYFIWTSSIGYEVVYPNGAYLQALADMWIRSTVPDQADECLDIIRENEMQTDWWEPLSLEGNYNKVHARSAFWAGWYDIFLVGTLAAFNGYNTQSNSNVRSTSKLFIDPLGHCQDAAKYFPQNAIAGRSLLPVMQSLETFGVRPVERPLIRNVTFYVMSSDDENGLAAGQYWTSLDHFPSPTMTKYYIHGDGSASTARPKGDDQATSSYYFDPSNPIPSAGGNNLAIPCGPLDQQAVDSRSDVVVFQTSSFSSELPLTGPLTATLFVSSDAIDTDFMVRISDVYPTGTVRLLQDNAIRMRWREGGLTPVWMEKGEVYEVTLTLWNTSYIVAPGHSLRFAISSSNYPRFDINRNNGILLANQTSTDVNVTAHNTIFHSDKYASFISLPVVKKAQLPAISDIKSMFTAAYPQVDVDKVLDAFSARMSKIAMHI